MNLGLLVSGNLGFTVMAQLLEYYPLKFVMTDKASLQVHSLCIENSIEMYVGNPRHEKTERFLVGKEVDVLVSVNYLFLIEKNLIQLPRKIAFNVHGSLLPKYRGRAPHIWAIINNERVTGITAHVIDEGCDTGDIIEQIEIPITPLDTGAGILQKYSVAYFPLIKGIIDRIEKGEIKTIKQDNSKATYFGKRTPADGVINWNWQKERIYNWVRALAYPYPGAFTYWRGSKITINALEISDSGYSYDIENGTVVGINPILVKSPNGIVLLKEIEPITEIEIGDILQSEL